MTSPAYHKPFCETMYLNGYGFTALLSTVSSTSIVS